MLRIISVCLGAVLLGLGPAAWAQEVEPAHFHHVHLNVTDPAKTLAYYKKIHGATETRYRGVADALFTERSFILMNEVAEPPASALTAGLWHIGWGGRDVPSEYEWFKKQPEVKIHTELYPLRSIFVTYLAGPDGEMIEVNTMGHNRYGHVHLLAADVNETAGWYKKHLGLRGRGFVPKPEDMSTVRAWSSGFRCDNVSFVVYGQPNYEPKPPWWEKEPVMTSFDPTDGRVIDHIAFSYRDLGPVFERMKANGAEIVRPIAHDDRFNHVSFFVRGPDKVLIEIVEAKPIPEGSWE
ncbi:MAG: VOC family protein [Candidatus Hydrogenedentes bacterium]|nr:VOC family protein [Candidatus Hydrogenedentota bacterium]